MSNGRYETSSENVWLGESIKFFFFVRVDRARTNSFFRAN
jgi:hypothetical protein